MRQALLLRPTPCGIQAQYLSCYHHCRQFQYLPMSVSCYSIHVLAVVYLFSLDLYHLFSFSFMTRALPSVLNATDLPIEYVRNVLNTDHVFSTAHFGVLASEANMLPGKGELLFRCLGHCRRRNFCCSLTKHAW